MGTVPTSFSGVCVEGQSDGFGAPGPVVPPEASAPGANWQMPPGQLPTVDGIPCTRSASAPASGFSRARADLTLIWFNPLK